MNDTSLGQQLDTWRTEQERRKMPIIVDMYCSSCARRWQRLFLGGLASWNCPSCGEEGKELYLDALVLLRIRQVAWRMKQYLVKQH